MSEGVYRGVAVPECPPIDKAVARVLAERALGASLPVIQFWNHPICSREQLTAWETDDVLAIDLGAEKYHSAGKQSAAEMVAELFYTNLSDLPPAVSRLLEIVAKNNQTGYLKGFPYSMAWTMRELYKLPGYDHHEVFDRAGEVIHTWLEAQESTSDTAYCDEGHIAEIFNKVDRHRQFGPFSVSRYIRDLWQLGNDIDEITEEAGFWVDGHDRAKAAIEDGKREFATMAKTSFVVNDLICTALETDNPFVIKAGSYACDILVAKNSRTGQAVIMTKKANTAPLARELRTREGELWYHQASQGIVLNGGFMYSGLTPTALSLETLVELVQQFPPVKQPHQQSRHTLRMEQ